MSELRSRYLDWPYEISVETFSRCNAACTFCPYTTLERIGTKLPDEILDQIIEELKDHPHPFILSPFKVNEPFLDKRLLPFCRKVEANLPKARLRIFTNGSALTDKHIEEVGNLRQVHHLWISLNSHDPDEYRELMSLDFERTTGNLDRLHAADFPHDVVLSKVAVEGWAHPVQAEFVAYCNRRWPKFQVFVIKADGWLGDIPLGSPEIPDRPCGRWFELSIMANGVVSHCCMDGEGKFPIGDITKQSLFEVYNSPEWRHNRLTMWSRKNVHPCSTCSY